MKKNVYDWLKIIDNELLFSVANGLSGAVISFSIDKKNIFRKSYGHQKKYEKLSLLDTYQTMSENTIFDVASLTKIFSTTLAYMILVDKKLIHIEKNIHYYFPEFVHKNITIQQLLGHNAGLPATFHFFNPTNIPKNFYSQHRDTTIKIISKIPLAYPPGTKTLYSDVGFILLGIILEKITGMRQDVFVEKLIYQPLGLQNTGYMLLEKGFKKNTFAANELCGNTRDGVIYFPHIRTHTLQGEVQDETAFYSMQKIAGNAGLFSSVKDLEILCQLLLNKGFYKNYTLCSPKTMDTFLQTHNIDGSYTLGLQRPSSNTMLTYGMLLPRAGIAYGHTGWTGTCFVVDYQHNASAIILTNKRHSPVIHIPQSDNHQFSGNLLPASTYGSIIQLFYAGLLTNTIS